ncbi:MAG: CRISPR-associated ring nuclease [Candidatus Freyarchaeota archaeon]
MKRVLIATLGESTSVVTEAIDFLRGEGKRIDEVIMLTTIDALTQDAVDLLVKHIPEHYRGQTWARAISIEAYEDIDSEEALIMFMREACRVLRGYIKAGNEVYVSISGGRKTMSALMTLAVQFYGARELFHIIVMDRELEEKSNITKLRHLNNGEKNRVLHPDPSKFKVIKMPFIGLFPWISDIVSALKGERKSTREIEELLTSNNLVEDGKLTPLGEIFLKIIEQVESKPPPRLEKPEILIGKHHHQKELHQIAQKLVNRISYVTRVRSIEWKAGKEKVQKEPPNKLKVYINTGKGYNLGFLLETTAETEGQLAAAAEEVKELLQKM